MAILGYVSDEMYVALPGVMGEFEPVVGGGEAVVLASSPRGAFRGELPPGRYRVTLAKAGYGSKCSTVDLGAGPVSFRLLADGLMGYMWPKWVRSGERAEYRVHAVEQYQLSLWRYGLEKEMVRMISWIDEHGQQAVNQSNSKGNPASRRS